MHWNCVLKIMYNRHVLHTFYLFLFIYFCFFWYGSLLKESEVFKLSEEQLSFSRTGNQCPQFMHFPAIV